MTSNRSAVVVLVGEQPAPNLLPIQHLRPDVVGVISTSRTARIAKNLELLLAPGITCFHKEVHPYRIIDIQQALIEFLNEKLHGYEIRFNLTGGTKPMAIAAFQVARMRHDMFFYLQSEGDANKVFHYEFGSAPDLPVLHSGTDILSDTLNLDQYLRMYLGTYTIEPPRDPFEIQIQEILLDISGVDEIFTSLRPQGMAALEVDFVLRCGNQIGIGEAKSKANKKAVDQLNGVAQQRYLGTYVRKFLISGHEMDSNNRQLAEAYRTQLIEILSYGRTGTISSEDRQLLIQKIQESMGLSS